METVVINGQPQISSTFGNRMVTYDGLVDFLEMLKDEIPKMGYNNILYDSAQYTYLFGLKNEAYGEKSFAIGADNYIGQGKCIYLLGENNSANASYSLLVGKQNEVDIATHAYVFGEKNCGLLQDDKIVKPLSVSHGLIGGSRNQIFNSVNGYVLGDYNIADQVTNAYGFGNHLTLTSNAVWLGKYNDPKTDVVVGIGNGQINSVSNLLTITKNGAVFISSQSSTENTPGFKNTLILGSNHVLNIGAPSMSAPEREDQCIQAIMLGEGLQLGQSDSPDSELDYSMLPPMCLLGRYNNPYRINSGALEGASSNCRLFEVGNGFSETARATCFYIEQSGKTFINQLSIKQPQESIVIEAGGDTSDDDPIKEITPGIYLATHNSQSQLVALAAIASATSTINTNIQSAVDEAGCISFSVAASSNSSEQITITVHNLTIIGSSQSARISLYPIILFN